VDIWRAAERGDLGEVERLVGQDPTLLHAISGFQFSSWTPLVCAFGSGHVEVVRWLLDKGAAITQTSPNFWGQRTVFLASVDGRLPVVKWEMEGRWLGRDWAWTPLMAASRGGHVEVVRVLLRHPDAQMIINHRDHEGQTALMVACIWGHGRVVRALLESGADPTIPNNRGSTPMAIAKIWSLGGRRDCVAELKVRLSSAHFYYQLAEAWLDLLGGIPRRRSGPTCHGRPGRWPISRGAARWR
jgi:hypothetical protein